MKEKVVLTKGETYHQLLRKAKDAVCDAPESIDMDSIVEIAVTAALKATERIINQ